MCFPALLQVEVELLSVVVGVEGGRECGRYNARDRGRVGVGGRMDAVENGEESVYDVGAAVVDGVLRGEHVKVDRRRVGKCVRVRPRFVEVSLEVQFELSVIVLSVLIGVKVEGGDEIACACEYGKRIVVSDE